MCLFIITCNALSALYGIVSTIDSALRVEAARTSKFAASAGSVKVAACASTSDSTAVQGGYMHLRSVRPVSLMGIGVVMFHIMC